jgi:hypothetical protein
MRVLKIALKIVFMVALFSFATMVLWNDLIPSIFNGPTISYVQAFGLLVLAKVLVSGFGFGRGGWGHWKWRHRHWQEFEEKMAKMSDEEREKYKANIKNKWMC